MGDRQGLGQRRNERGASRLMQTVAQRFTQILEPPGFERLD